jgi:hypothetical protein
MSGRSKRPRKPVSNVDDADGAATGGVSASASEGGGPPPKRQKRKKKAAARAPPPTRGPPPSPAGLTDIDTDLEALERKLATDVGVIAAEKSLRVEIARRDEAKEASKVSTAAVRALKQQLKEAKKQRGKDRSELQARDASVFMTTNLLDGAKAKAKASVKHRQGISRARETSAPPERDCRPGKAIKVVHKVLSKRIMGYTYKTTRRILIENEGHAATEAKEAIDSASVLAILQRWGQEGSNIDMYRLCDISIPTGILT